MMNTMIFTSTSAGVGKGMMSCAYKTLGEAAIHHHELEDGYTMLEPEADIYFAELFGNITETFDEVQDAFEIALDRAANYDDKPVRIIVSEPCTLGHLARLMERTYADSICLPKRTFIVLDPSLVTVQTEATAMLTDMEHKIEVRLQQQEQAA